ncbi:hypothetical protein Hanom_Chr15g01367481 [Helianthus anomalus]
MFSYVFLHAGNAPWSSSFSDVVLLFLSVLKFVFFDPHKRLSRVVIIYASLLWVYNISKNSKIEQLLLGIYNHLVAVSVFVPSLIF